MEVSIPPRYREELREHRHSPDFKGIISGLDKYVHKSLAEKKKKLTKCLRLKYDPKAFAMKIRYSSVHLANSFWQLLWEFSTKVEGCSETVFQEYRCDLAKTTSNSAC